MILSVTSQTSSRVLRFDSEHLVA